MPIPRILGSQNSGIPEFRDPRILGSPEFWDTQNSGIPEFWDPRNSGTPEFWDPQNSGIPEFWDPRILGIPIILGCPLCTTDHVSSSHNGTCSTVSHYKMLYLSTTEQVFRKLVRTIVRHVFGHFSDFFPLVPGVFPGGRGIIERRSREVLGVFWDSF